MATQCNATELVPARQNPPKDGYGPRGAPDCYYTSRVLDSTARYVKFVKKLRTLEEEQRKGAVNTLKELTDKQISDFFIRCDRRSLINNVARRVDLCLSSYQEDLKAKRQSKDKKIPTPQIQHDDADQGNDDDDELEDLVYENQRLLNLLSQEEELNIRKFVEQAQAGAEALWQDKKDRLAYLLAKRKREHEEKYKDVPISKCAHVHPCIVALRARKSQEGQLYQMKEKQARKMAEIEMDNMWHEVALKESEALAARMEFDSIERLRRNHECVKYGDEQIRQKNEQRKRDQEQLKLDTMRMMAMLDEQNKQEDKEKHQREQKRLETARDRKQMIQERKDTIERQDAEAKLIGDTWDSLAGMGLADEKAKEELVKQKRREVDVCNHKMGKIAQDKKLLLTSEDVFLAAKAKQQQDLDDKRRCDYIRKHNKEIEECQDAVKQQIKDNAATRERKAKETADYDDYQSQLAKHIDQLVAHKELTEAQARKLYQKNLQKQIDYNQLLKDRAKEEELLQREKGKIAMEEYKLGITKMMSRLYFSDEMHPFAKPMRDGLKMREKCPCSKPDYCAVPVLVPKGASGPKPGASSSK